MQNITKNFLSGPFCANPNDIQNVYYTVLQYIGNNDKLPIIDIGSGNGYLGFLLNKLFNVEVIGVDPISTDDENCYKYISNANESNFDTSKLVKPTFETTNDPAINKYIENCIVSISWPFYDQNSDGYDIKAVTKLKPLGFVITYGPCGAAGSKELINLFSNFDEYCITEGENYISLPYDHIDINGILYTCVWSKTVTYGSGYGFTGKTHTTVGYVRDKYVENGFEYAHQIVNENKEEDNMCIIS